MRRPDFVPVAVVIIAGLFCLLTVIADRAVEPADVCPPPSTIFGAPDRMEPTMHTPPSTLEAVQRMEAQP